ncbi:MAG: hypothetical protein SGBAC_006222 [Bacillariaceae sp.]
MIAHASAFSPPAEFQAIELEALLHNVHEGISPASMMMHFLHDDQIENSVNGVSTEAPILVAGATGRVGRQIVYHLLEDNIPVRALVRNADKAGELFFEFLGGRSSLELVVCDLDTADEESIKAATKGCESVINVTGKQHAVFQEQSQHSFLMTK